MDDAVKGCAKDKSAARAACGNTGPAAAPALPSLRYIASLFVGILGALAAFYISLFMLLATDNLPPPAFANNLCVDEKLSFMREHPSLSPNLLVVGSSVAWRHFDGTTVAKISQGTKPLNGAFCGLYANQTVYVANWLLDRQPTLRQVLMIAAPQDFTECRQHRDAVFDQKDAGDFVYDGGSPWWYYMRYFSPRSLLRNAQTVRKQRANLVEWDPLVFNSFGDGPLEPKAADRGLSYGAPAALDTTCFNALQALATRLQREGRQLLVVATPLHPDWKKKEDPTGVFLDDFDRRIRKALQGTDARYWDADHEWTPAPAAFVDAIHLRWSAAKKFSAALAQHLPPR